MDAVLLARQGLLFLHIIVFAIAFAEIARGDWHLLRTTRIDLAGLATTARVVTISLIGLWATGLGLIALDTGFDPSLIVARPKLVAKLIAVSVLTGNGVLLHHYAFPMLRLAPSRPARLAVVAALGAISTVSWTFAAFVGSARLIAGAMGLEAFLALYGIGLVAGVAAAVVAVAPMLRAKLPPRTSPADDEARWMADPEGQAMEPARVDERETRSA